MDWNVMCVCRTALDLSTSWVVRHRTRSPTASEAVSGDCMAAVARLKATLVGFIDLRSRSRLCCRTGGQSVVVYGVDTRSAYSTLLQRVRLTCRSNITLDNDCIGQWSLMSACRHEDRLSLRDTKARTGQPAFHGPTLRLQETIMSVCLFVCRHSPGSACVTLPVTSHHYTRGITSDYLSM